VRVAIRVFTDLVDTVEQGIDDGQREAVELVAGEVTGV
jgi:hypothetical protein